MIYEEIFLDLDGTVTDSFPGIASSFTYALGFFGIEVKDSSELRRVVGPPLKDSFMNFYGLSDADADTALVKYREYYKERGIFDNSVYDGVEDMIRTLSEAGKRVYLATSKPRPFAERIIAHFGLTDYFTFVGGSEFDGTRSEKHEVIEYIIDRFAIKDRKAVLMVGDRLHDADGARKCGIDCCGVLYGYGTREELELHGVKYICDTPGDVVRLILTGSD